MALKNVTKVIDINIKCANLVADRNMNTITRNAIDGIVAVLTDAGHKEFSSDSGFSVAMLSGRMTGRSDQISCAAQDIAGTVFVVEHCVMHDPSRKVSVGEISDKLNAYHLALTNAGFRCRIGNQSVVIYSA